MRRVDFLTAFVFLLCALTACATRIDAPDNSESATDAGAQIARTALNMLGTPYVYGGNDANGFDCSGLVQFTHARIGIQLPRTTAMQFRHKKKNSATMKPGDVLFFRIGGRVSHSGIYLGKGRFVHAPSSGKNVSVSSTDNPYFRARLAGVRRFHE